MRNVYLVNLSFGLAGIERRFANIWRTLQIRGNVRPILVVPDTLGTILREAGLIAGTDAQLLEIREPRLSRSLFGGRWPASLAAPAAFLRSRAMARAFRPMWERVRNDPDAVVHFGMNCSALVPPDVPIVYECVDSTLQQLSTGHYVRAASRPCVVHCQTERIRTVLERENAGRRPRWTTVISPCYFAAYPPEAAVARADRDPRLVAFVGRLAPEKNPLLFVDAIARVRAAGVPVRGVMLGEGPSLGEVRRRIAELGLGDAITVSFVRNPGAELTRAAILATLQTGDNYGSQSLLEAMGAGCAIIATGVGETGRLIDHNVGRLVRHDPDDLAAAIRAMVLDPAGTAAQGAAASARARAEYSADAYVAFLETLYAQAVRLHGAARGVPTRSRTPTDAIGHGEEV